MKKKSYITPDIQMLEVEDVMLLSGSGVTSDDMDLDYGGVDDDGDHDPASPEIMYWWRWRF